MDVSWIRERFSLPDSFSPELLPVPILNPRRLLNKRPSKLFQAVTALGCDASRTCAIVVSSKRSGSLYGSNLRGIYTYQLPLSVNIIIATGMSLFSWTGQGLERDSASYNHAYFSALWFQGLSRHHHTCRLSIHLFAWSCMALGSLEEVQIQTGLLKPRSRRTWQSPIQGPADVHFVERSTHYSLRFLQAQGYLT